MKQPGAKIEARNGYYADRDFKHTASTDRATALQNQLFSAIPATDLPVLVNASYYRVAADRYFVPIAVAVPGSAIPIPADKDKDKMELDVLGFVRDEQGRPVGRLQQTLTAAGGFHRDRRLPPDPLHLCRSNCRPAASTSRSSSARTPAA